MEISTEKFELSMSTRKLFTFPLPSVFDSYGWIIRIQESGIILNIVKTFFSSGSLELFKVIVNKQQILLSQFWSLISYSWYTFIIEFHLWKLVLNAQLKGK